MLILPLFSTAERRTPIASRIRADDIHILPHPPLLTLRHVRQLTLGLEMPHERVATDRSWSAVLVKPLCGARGVGVDGGFSWR